MLQRLGDFEERSKTVRYQNVARRAEQSLADAIAAVPASRRTDADRWLKGAEAGRPDWTAFGELFFDQGCATVATDMP
jgi:hypothetical protein